MFLWASFLFHAWGAANAQSPLLFDAISVKPSTPRPSAHFSSQMGGDAGRIDYYNVSIKMMVEKAYGLEEYRVSCPEWMATTGYDVVATIPKGASPAQVASMLQAMLAERFKLTVHLEPRDMQVYALTRAKNGPRLPPAEGDSSYSSQRDGKITGKRMTIERLISYLDRVMDHPIVDRTGLTGEYNIALDFEIDPSMIRRPATPGSGSPVAMSNGAGGGRGAAAAGGDPGGPSIFAALPDQLGLKLEATKAPIEVLVVDHAEKAPIGN